MSVLTEKLPRGNRTISDEIREDVFADILSGRLEAGQKLETRELAEKWQVSIATVSQSLQALAANGILNRKKRMGTFVGENAYSAIAANRTDNIIRALVPFEKQNEYASMFKGLQTAAEKQGFSTLIDETNDDVAQYKRFIREQIKSNTPTVLIPPLSTTLPTEVLIELYDSKIPVVTCYRSIEGFGWPMVGIDNVHNTYIAAKHLCDMGRKNIALIGSDKLNSYQGLLKEHVFLKTLEEHNLPHDYSSCLWLESNANKGEMWMTNAINFISDWLQQRPDTDAICCLHDHAAWAAVGAAAKLGKRIPDDLAIIGNGNFSMFGFEHNDLSTIDMCYKDFGEAIVGLLKDISFSGQIEPNTQVLIKGEVVVRNSTIG